LHILRCSSLRQWREEYVPLSGLRADFEPLNNAPFHVSFSLPVDLPGILKCRFSPGMCIRTAEHIQAGDDWFELVITKTTGTRHEQLGHHLRLNRGEATLMRGDEPRGNGSPAGFQGFSVIVPPAEFDARGIRPDDAVMLRMPSQREALGLLQSYLRSLERRGIDQAVGFGTMTPVREIVQRHILDLAALAVTWQGAVGESDLDSVADARLRAALDYITAHFTDPRLTIEIVARSQGISARYLRRLMQRAGDSYVEVVNELRLQQAFTALTTADQDRRTILDFAVEAGFSDISHFNRLFRARFGDTPSGVRAQNRQSEHPEMRRKTPRSQLTE